MSTLASYAAFIQVVRTGMLYVGIAVAAICAIDWAVRTRRINPFSRVARFFRGSIDPIMAPVERVIVRAGGVPSAASWWTLVAYAVFGILLISLLEFIGGILYQVVAMTSLPASEAWRIPVGWIFEILRLAVLVRVLSSWLPISPMSKWIRWSYVLTDWMIRPLQRLVPRIGMFDISPIVAWLLLTLAEKVVLS
jgi:YggT family protein